MTDYLLYITDKESIIFKNADIEAYRLFNIDKKYLSVDVHNNSDTTISSSFK